VQLLQEVADDLKTQMAAAAAAAGQTAQSGQHIRPNSRQQQRQLRQLDSDEQEALAVSDAPQPAVVVANKKQAVLTSMLLPDASMLSWEQQLAAMRQELRVIVGKGLHSSGGEASLPRVVEQWLQQHKYRYLHRGGCIGVQLSLL
jgi:DNA-nicking Smr family endonuclease